MKKSQLEFIKEKLLTDGFITRNYCLKNYISRLGARINDLKRAGWNVEGKHEENGDYIYELKGSPYQKIVYRVPELDNKEITTFKQVGLFS